MSTRRAFINRIAAAFAVLRRPLRASQSKAAVAGADPDFIVVGSGAGGGTVAARLAELGHTVLVLEAGGDPKTLSGGNALHPEGNTLPDDYDVPAFHANATENEAMKWDFFVRHYADLKQQEQDPKYIKEFGGVLYPRAGTLGGCTAHNAMIFVYPHNEDWQNVVDATGDSSWAPDKMRRYFEKLENCHYRGFERFLKDLTGLNLSRHGFGGWLRTEQALPLDSLLGDKNLNTTIKQAIAGVIRETGSVGKQIIQGLESLGDPNDWRLVKAKARGIRYTPLTTSGHTRTGTRDRLRDVEKRFPDRIRIETEALATKVIFDDQKRAVGVEYLKGKNLYRPHGEPSATGEKKVARASREVILCGGAFNTPQLLMLSGIGPEDELARVHIQPVSILEGVGKNLQDRYEVGIVHKLKKPFESLNGANFEKGDLPYKQWSQRRQGIYTANGVILGAIEQSSVSDLPDLFCFGLLGDFQGYRPGYSTLFAKEHDHLTWAILKAHTLNNGGTVTLRSANPLEAPLVNFHYFDEGTDQAGKDLEAVVEGIQFIRKVTDKLDVLEPEEFPGREISTTEQLKEFVKDNAWGHHASCTCKIGTDKDPRAVLNSDFEVIGVNRLRVVDASIFPKIPGFFIVSSIYMAAEKAAEVIHQQSTKKRT